MTVKSFRQYLLEYDDFPMQKNYDETKYSNTPDIAFEVSLSWKELGISSSEFDVRPMTHDELYNIDVRIYQPNIKYAIEWKKKGHRIQQIWTTKGKGLGIISNTSFDYQVIKSKYYEDIALKKMFAIINIVLKQHKIRMNWPRDTIPGVSWNFEMWNNKEDVHQPFINTDNKNTIINSKKFKYDVGILGPKELTRYLKPLEPEIQKLAKKHL